MAGLSYNKDVRNKIHQIIILSDVHVMLKIFAPVQNNKYWWSKSSIQILDECKQNYVENLVLNLSDKWEIIKISSVNRKENNKPKQQSK